MYSVLDAVLLRPLPYPSPERLVQVGWLPYGSDDLDVLTVADAEALAGAPPFDAFGVYTPAQGGVTWTHGGEGERLDGSFVTPGFRAALAIAPALGTGPYPGSDRLGEPRAVLLSHTFWSERLGSDSTAVGRVLELDGEPHTVSGVMPKGFHIPGRPRDEVWPILQTAPPDYRAPFWLRGVARPSAGVDPELAGERLRAVETVVKERSTPTPHSSGPTGSCRSTACSWPTPGRLCCSSSGASCCSFSSRPPTSRTSCRQCRVASGPCAGWHAVHVLGSIWSERRVECGPSVG